ncbi:hypothetical protein LFYK43_21300 [Ligilactobacillus salitolerans]|uniref:Chemotaxis protein n=1 Tax=Ligilactobacillus salitolerans TaxID=1808352 RepID=A0A401IVU1_9LACO|nr:hypothetical protein [Ligilactobacillus salitolerans]GBG95671.1 hypothetical protein LFYK43_21300 [Ligilactobacillus salitolerans]
MKKKANLGQYLQLISSLLETTEEMGGKLDPYFELADGVVKDQQTLDTEQYQQIQTNFAAGIEVYQQQLGRLERAEAPIMIIGPHKQLVKSYRDFVSGCQAMQDSIDYEQQNIDAAAFKKSEKEQTDAMDAINAHVGRIMQKVG